MAATFQSTELTGEERSASRSSWALLGYTRGMAKHREEQESLDLGEAKLNFSACDLLQVTKALTLKYPLIH